jgi:hypothetical protein
MPREPLTTTVPAYVARTQLGALLRQVRERRARFIITKSGKHRAGKSIALRDHLKERLTRRAG